MFDGVVSLLTYHASMYLTAQVVSRRVGNRHATIAPYDTMPASDGEFFLAVGNDEQFQRFCRVAGLSPLATDDRFATNPARVAHHEELRRLLSSVLATRTRAEWIAELTAAGVPCGDVRDVPEVLADPQVLARRMIEVVQHAAAGPLQVLGVPIKLSDTPGAVRTAPPTLGQHTERVLNELGMSGAEIERLRRCDVI
jgi:crotonobetainyl-CoA:carnitine CoA-transferase CaiB-like acyl-CoA transferase